MISGGKIVVGDTTIHAEISRPFQIYVAGPMRGYPHWNFDAFANATWHLRGRYRITVIDPSEMDMMQGFDPFVVTEEEFTRQDWHAAMRRDFRRILECDGIALLPGWEKSEGAKAELFVARTIGIEVFLYDHREGLIWWPDKSSDG